MYIFFKLYNFYFNNANIKFIKYYLSMFNWTYMYLNSNDYNIDQKIESFLLIF